MNRFEGTCEMFASVGVTSLAAWISAVPLEEWPQQSRLADGQIRPAMVNDPEWFGFQAQTDAIVAEVLSLFPGCEASRRMLSVVMPGHEIEPHIDARGQRNICRVHVPIISNDNAMFIMGETQWNMRPGEAYRINTESEHAIVNNGDTPRVHFMFEVSGRS